MNGERLKVKFISEAERTRQLAEVAATLSQLESEMVVLNELRIKERGHIIEEQEHLRREREHVRIEYEYMRATRERVDERIENLNGRITLLRRLLSRIVNP